MLWLRVGFCFVRVEHGMRVNVAVAAKNRIEKRLSAEYDTGAPTAYPHTKHLIKIMKYL